MTTTDTESLPDLSSEYSLSDEQVESYRANGHILLPGVLSPEELAAYRPLINRAADAFNEEKRPLEERDTYGKAFLQIMNLWERDESVRRFTLARRFGGIAARFMGVSGVRIYHDQALFKEPGGGPTPWHQDQSYWPLDTNNTITMWMPLVDILPQVGTMNFASGSHKFGLARASGDDQPISDDSERDLDAWVKENGLQVVNYGAMKAGDATWHAGWTLHGAPGNPTQTLREVMTIIYFADGTRITPPETPFQENDLARWMPEMKAGEFAASALNPLIEIN